MPNESKVATMPTGIRFEADKGTYKVDYIRMRDGHRIHVYRSGIPTLKEALRLKEELFLQRLEEYRRKKRDVLCFGDFYDRYVDYRSLHVRQSSLLQARAVKNKLFLPYLGLPTSTVLSSSYLKAFYDVIILDETLSCPWKNRIIGVLRNMVSVAFKWKMLSSEEYQEGMAVLENVPERTKFHERIIWSEEEERRFLRVIEEESHRVMFLLFMELGARISEFLALRWEDYDSKSGTIVIRHQLLNNSQKTFVVSDVLKTKESYRSCRIRKEVKEALLLYRKEHADSPYLFPNPHNPKQPLSKAMFRKCFEEYMRRAKVRRVTPHAIRHAKATKLLRACRNMLEVKAVARYMGHSASVLMDIYSHSETTTIDSVLSRIHS